MDFPKARALQEEALALRQELGDRWGMALSLKNLGRIAIEQGDLRSAHVFQTESLRLQQQLGNLPGVVMALEGFALTAQAQSQPRRSARLLSAASALRESINYPLPPGERMEYDRHVAEVEREVGAERFAAETAAGRVMSLEQAIEYALAEETE